MIYNYASINNLNVFQMKKAFRMEIEECLVPTFPITRNESTKAINIYNPSVIKSINKMALGKVKIDKPRNIIISRGQAYHRRIVNEEAICNLLPKFNFEIVVLEHLSFLEQMNLFANANIILGLHGSGLVNMLFSKNPLIIEFFPSTRANRDAFYFYQLSQALDFEHHVFEYTPVNEFQDFQFNEEMANQVQTLISNSGRTTLV
ncbi:DUF563 domain-containing protein [Bacteroidota bacterium]